MEMSLFLLIGAMLVPANLALNVSAIYNRFATTGCDSSHEGNLYYLTFMTNLPDQPKHVPIEIFVSTSSEQAQVTVEMTTGYKQTKTATRTTMAYFTVPREQAMLKDGGGRSTRGTVVRVSSDQKIVVYGSNKEQYTTDAFLGLPENVIGTQYYAVTWYPPSNFAKPDWCQIAIGGTREPTTVEIRLPKLHNNIISGPNTRVEVFTPPEDQPIVQPLCLPSSITRMGVSKECRLPVPSEPYRPIAPAPTASDEYYTPPPRKTTEPAYYPPEPKERTTEAYWYPPADSETVKPPKKTTTEAYYYPEPETPRRPKPTTEEPYYYPEPETTRRQKTTTEAYYYPEPEQTRRPQPLPQLPPCEPGQYTAPSNPCRPIEQYPPCPPGQVMTPANPCRPVEIPRPPPELPPCPQGQVMTPANPCRPIEPQTLPPCMPGEIMTPARPCRPIEIPRPPAELPPCPPGQFTTPANPCRPVETPRPPPQLPPCGEGQFTTPSYPCRPVEPVRPPPQLPPCGLGQVTTPAYPCRPSVEPVRPPPQLPPCGFGQVTTPAYPCRPVEPVRPPPQLPPCGLGQVTTPAYPCRPSVEPVRPPPQLPPCGFGQVTTPAYPCQPFQPQPQPQPQPSPCGSQPCSLPQIPSIPYPNDIPFPNFPIPPIQQQPQPQIPIPFPNFPNFQIPATQPCVPTPSQPCQPRPQPCAFGETVTPSGCRPIQQLPPCQANQSPAVTPGGCRPVLPPCQPCTPTPAQPCQPQPNPCDPYGTQNIPPGADSVPYPNLQNMVGSFPFRAQRLDGTVNIYAAYKPMLYPGTGDADGYYVPPAPMNILRRGTKQNSDKDAQFDETSYGDYTETQIECQVEHEGRVYKNGETIRIELQPLEAIQIQAKCDLTGTFIKSSRPVSVFSGNARTAIGPGAITRDHLAEQIPPVPTWGRTFVTIPTPRRTVGDYYKIVASEDGTKVVISGRGVECQQKTLNAGQQWQVDLPCQTFAYIVASKPILVVHFVKSQTVGTEPADPAMTVIMPIEQFGLGYTFSTLEGVATKYENFMTVAVHSGKENSLLIDGVPLRPADGWAEIPTTNVTIGYVALQAGTHTVSSQNGDTRFAAYIYGAGDRESYAYPTGMCLKLLTCPSTPGCCCQRCDRGLGLF